MTTIAAKEDACQLHFLNQPNKRAASHIRRVMDHDDLIDEFIIETEKLTDLVLQIATHKKTGRLTDPSQKLYSLVKLVHADVLAKLSVLVSSDLRPEEVVDIEAGVQKLAHQCIRTISALRSYQGAHKTGNSCLARQ
ncbi:MAG: hypothetical protein GY948_03245 [Alphaproteobacteria bacterium]|nr:hypothetical protein [Alphaproteobacteria bacterium]